MSVLSKYALCELAFLSAFYVQPLDMKISLLIHLFILSI
jgi:hypothetical protein